MDIIIKSVKNVDLNIKITIAFFNTCLCCDKNYQQEVDGKLKQRFFNT